MEIKKWIFTYLLASKEAKNPGHIVLIFYHPTVIKGYTGTLGGGDCLVGEILFRI